MHLTRNSPLDPVANRLRIQLQLLSDLGDRQECSCNPLQLCKRSVPGASAGEGGEWVTAVVGGEQFAEVGE